VLIDANLLIYALDTESPHHASAATWVEDVFNGDQRVALPLQTIGAVVRITTHPKIMTAPFDASTIAGVVDDWLALPNVWVPPAGGQTAHILSRLIRTYRLTANLVPDGQLAAMAIEHGIAVASTDTDFARFSEVTWINPLAA